MTQPATEAARLTLQCQFCLAWNRVSAARVDDRPKCGKCAKPMLLDRPWTLTEESFQRTVTETELPVLVDFYAEWCGPCKMMAPFVDELARDYQGRALVAKLDTDRAPALVQALGIRGMPTTVVFKSGKPAAQKIGAMPKPALEALLKQALE